MNFSVQFMKSQLVRSPGTIYFTQINMQGTRHSHAALFLLIIITIFYKPIAHQPRRSLSLPRAWLNIYTPVISCLGVLILPITRVTPFYSKILLWPDGMIKSSQFTFCTHEHTRVKSTCFSISLRQVSLFMHTYGG